MLKGTEMYSRRAVPALLENDRAVATCPLPINNQKVYVKTASVLPRPCGKTEARAFLEGIIPKS